MNEHDLVKNLQAAKSGAYTEFQRLFRGQIVGFLYGMLHDAEAAEDLWTEVQMRVWAHVSTFQWHTEGNFTAWVRRIARNLVLNRIRSQKAAPQEVISSLALEQLQRCDNIDFDEETPSVLTPYDAIFWDAFQKIPERYQDLLRLRATHCAPKDIAKITGDDPATVRVKLNQAAKALIRRMAGHPQTSLLSLTLPTHTQFLHNLKEAAFQLHQHENSIEGKS